MQKACEKTAARLNSSDFWPPRPRKTLRHIPDMTQVFGDRSSARFAVLARSQRFSLVQYLCAVSILASTLLCGCEEDKSEGAGTPPMISNATANQPQIQSGSLQTIQITFDFEDPDGDIHTAQAHVKTDKGLETMTNDAEIQGAHGLTKGKAVVAFALQLPEPGTVELHITADDAHGNTSNLVTVLLPIVEPSAAGTNGNEFQPGTTQK